LLIHQIRMTSATSWSSDHTAPDRQASANGRSPLNNLIRQALISFAPPAFISHFFRALFFKTRMEGLFQRSGCHFLPRGSGVCKFRWEILRRKNRVPSPRPASRAMTASSPAIPPPPVRHQFQRQPSGEQGLEISSCSCFRLPSPMQSSTPASSAFSPCYCRTLMQFSPAPDPPINFPIPAEVVMSDALQWRLQGTGCVR
jgi:hypothetical protein